MSHAKNACVRTAHTLHIGLKVFVPNAGKVCGVAMHAVGGDAGSGLLRLLSKPNASATSAVLLGLDPTYACYVRFINFSISFI